MDLVRQRFQSFTRKCEWGEEQRAFCAATEDSKTSADGMDKDQGPEQKPSPVSGRNDRHGVAVDGKAHFKYPWPNQETPLNAG